MPMIAPVPKTPVAAALIRAGLVDEIDAAALIIDSNAGTPAELTALVVALAGLSVRTLLAANGGDIPKSLAVIDQWMDRAAEHCAEPAA
jgi:hypothetical protein